MHKLNATLLARILPKSIFVAGVVLCSFVGSLLLSSPTHAQQPAALPASLVKEAKQRALMEAMVSCMRGSRFEKVSSAEITSGDWQGDWAGGGEYVGPIVDESDGNYSCNSELPKALKDAFGYGSFVDLMCDLGATTENPNNGCSPGDSYGTASNYSLSGDNSQIDKAESSLIKKSGSQRIGDENNDLLNYVVAYHALTSNGGCGASFRGARASNSGDQNNALKQKKAVSLWVVGGSGAFDAYYTIKEGKSATTVVNLFSSHFHRSGSGGNGDRKTCEEIARWASDLAPKVASTLAQAGTESTNNEVINALVGKFCQGLTGYPLSSCQSDVKKWVEACKSKMPTSGAVSESSEYVNCLSQQSGKYLDDIKAALGSISIPDESSETEEEEVTCAIEGVGWMICPTVRFLADMSDNIYGFLRDSFLQIETKLFDTSNNAYTAWSVMRNVANALFVVAFIFIVYSQITGAGISNYGIKKMLPMLLIAALLVNMSYFICQLAVDLSNILGGSVYGMFKGWAGSMNTGNYAAVDELTAEGVMGGIAILVLAGVGGYLALSALSAAAIATIIALLSVFLLLIARKALVILLVVIAPLAFVALLLPNTQSLFTKWRKIFVSMLLVYPIIGLLFGAGSLAATILNEAAGTDDMIMQIVGALSAVLPLFMVIPVLKKSMDAAGAISGFINRTGDKATGAAQNRFGESRMGRSLEHMKRERARRRAMMMAGQTDRKNPFSRTKAALNRGLNKITPGGRQIAAAGAKLSVGQENEKVDEQEALIRSSVSDVANLPDEAARQLMSAANSGNVAQARAAQRILMNSGAPGLAMLHDTLHSLESSGKLAREGKVSRAVRQDINDAGIKARDNVLNSWAYSNDSNPTNNTIAAKENTASTFTGLNAAEIAGQHISNLQGAAQGAISADMAKSILENQEIRKTLSQEKIEFFENVATSPTPVKPVTGDKRSRSLPKNGPSTPPGAP